MQEPDCHSEHSRRRSEKSRRKSGGNGKDKHRRGGSSPVRDFGSPQHDCLNVQEARRTLGAAPSFWTAKDSMVGTLVGYLQHSDFSLQTL